MAIYNFVAKDTGTDCGAIQGASTTYGDPNEGVIGIWDVGNGKYLPGTSDILSLMNTTYTDDQSGSPAADIPQHYIYPDSFQVVQGRGTGQPLATPIIYGKDVTHMAFRIYVAPIKQVQTSVLTAPASATTDSTIKIVTKGCPTGYDQVLDAVNPDVSYRVGQVFSVTINGDGSGGAVIDTLGAAVAAAFTADTECPVLCTYASGSNTFTFTSKDYGHTFDVITSTSNFSDIAPTVPLQGEGGAADVQAMEKKSLANYGYHNRIWIPGSTSNNLMSAGHSVNGYDLIQIKAKSRDGNGFNREFKNGRRGNIVINMWYDEAWTDGASTLDTANPFGLTIAAGTGQAFQFQNGVGTVDPS